MDRMAADVVIVGDQALGESDLLRLAKAGTVIGSPQLVRAVAHLCSPRTQTRVLEEGAGPEEEARLENLCAGAQPPVVILASPDST